jgi:hypothetical protein
MLRMLREQLVPRAIRIEPGGMTELVEEALGREAVVRVADRAPKPDGNSSLDRRVLDAQVRDRVRQIGRTFGGGRVGDATAREQARRCRRRDSAQRSRCTVRQQRTDKITTLVGEDRLRDDALMPRADRAVRGRRSRDTTTADTETGRSSREKISPVC